MPATGRCPGWLLDEMVSIGRENLHAAHVARYDAKEIARTAQETNAASSPEVALLASVGLDADATVVDLGAGTGQFALAVRHSAAVWWRLTLRRSC